MNNISIRIKLAALVAVFVLGVGILVLSVYNSTPDTLEASDYRDVMSAKDLLADILPPPLYAIEAITLARRAPLETNKDDLDKLRERWKKVEADYASRRKYWAERMAPSAMRVTLLETSHHSVERLFAIGDAELWPAVQAGDITRANAALNEMTPLYRAHRQLIDDLVLDVDKHAQAQAELASAKIHGRKLFLLALGIGIVLVGGFIAMQVARSISERTSGMARMLAKVAQGDLSQRASVDSDDELGDMSQQLNMALQSIEHVFAQVRNVAAELGEAASTLASSSDKISQGAQQQAAGLEETAASLEEITATVKQSAGSAQQADQVAVGSRDTAERGGSIVAGAIAAMDEITKASRRIKDIITTIDEIALQTNLLALNAAVEAARAGEQGRGFAVVAAEVGNLAQRSAAAAKEVKTLIQDSLERIQAGHQLVGESGRALTDIIVSVKKVTEIVGEIAGAAREQSIGVDQVNQAISQMDQVTQSNAAQTDQLSHTAQGLAESAENLQDLLTRFQISRDADRAPVSPSIAQRLPPLPLKKPTRRNGHRGRALLDQRDLGAQLEANDNASADFEVLSSNGGRGA